MTDVRIEKSKENQLLRRKEVKFRVFYQGFATPTRDEIRELIARNTSSKKELVIVDSMNQLTGKNEATGYAKVYKDKESALLYEPDYELLRNGLKQIKVE